MPEPLPLTELLARLKDRGLPIGLREHLAVGRLLARWNGDLPGLRAALAAVLARGPAEVQLVRRTFDEVYGEGRPEPGPPPPPPAPVPPSPRRWRWRWRRGLVAALVAVFSLIAVSLGREVPPLPFEVPALPGARVPQKAPPPPKIAETFPRTSPILSLAGAAIASLAVLFGMSGLRIRREAESLGRRLWSRAASALPGPYRYEFDLRPLAPPFPSPVLDEAARLLGREAPAPSRDLDVDRTVDRTLRAGMAPVIVLEERACPAVLLVLEDVSSEMRPFRRRVRALLDGLAARGVPLDLWRFHGDAGRVFRSPGRDETSLAHLARRSGGPLLILSSGEGLLDSEGRLAPWAGALAAWERRVWLHPVTDASYWRPQLGEIPIEVLPMTSGGLLAAVYRLLGRPVPPRAGLPVFPDRPVTPLDVDLLRWLLSLAPRRDPDLAELLRQQFFPRLPPAALLEVLRAPAPAQPPRLSPPTEEVHGFLARLLAASRPEAGSAAYERWRLDLALHEVHVPGRQDGARRELEALAEGPLAGDVERAARRLPDRSLGRQLRQDVEARAEREGRAAVRSGRGAWSRRQWPDPVEWSAALLCGLLLFWGIDRLSARPEAVQMLELYELQVLDPDGRGPFYLTATRRAGAPGFAWLVRQDRRIEELGFLKDFAATYVRPEGRGHWYYLRAAIARDSLAISNRVWVGTGAASPTPPAAGPPGPREPAPTPEEPQPPAREPEPPAPEGDRGDESLTTGTLEISGFPEDLPPGLLHIVGDGLPEIGAPWDGGAVRLAPGSYLLVVQLPRVSLPIERVEIRAGETLRFAFPERSVPAIRSQLDRSAIGEGGPKIDSVIVRVFSFWPRGSGSFSVEIKGTNFDPKATVSVSAADYMTPPEIYYPATCSPPACTIDPTSISCDCSVHLPPNRPYDPGLYVRVEVVNPDGRVAVGEGSGGRGM